MRFDARLLAMLVAAALAGCGGENEPGSEEDDLFGAPELLGPDPSGSPTRYPIVLAHGLGGSPDFLGFYLVADALRADGHVVYEGEVPPFQAADVRAGFLAATVDRALEETGAAKVNILAHSMGGLDARALVSKLGYGEVVATVTTISTPHHGTGAADVGLGILHGLGSPSAALAALATAWGATFSDVAENPDVIAALQDLTEAGAEGWNRDHPDDPRVAYLSWAGVSSALGLPNARDDGACEHRWLVTRSGRRTRPDVMGPLVAGAAPFVAHGAELRPNDGLVSVESAKWGAFAGCMPADHADEVGALRHTRPDAVTGFDHRRFYRNLAYSLAASGY